MSNSDFYIEHNFLPTKTQIDFSDTNDYNFYKNQRLFLLEDLLNIPRKFLDGCNYLEIGPDAGENAIFAASLGSKVTCIDPNPLSIAAVNNLFNNFPDSSVVERLADSKVCYFEDYKGDKKFDLIACEGMIHTVSDAQKFYEKLAFSSEHQGFVVISYCNELSIFADLFHSKVFKSLVANHLKICDINKGTINEIVSFGEKLFSNKWSRLAHLRSLETWLMDVLLNPAVKSEKTVNTLSMLKSFQECGLNYWSSWPRYEKVGEMRWHRNVKNAEEKFVDISIQYKKLSLQFLLGHSTDFMLIVNDTNLSEDLYGMCCKIVSDLDNSDWTGLGDDFNKLVQILKSDTRFIHTQDYYRILSILNMLIEIVDYIKLDLYQDLVKYLTSSSGSIDSSFEFNNYWGQPNHYLVLYKN